jgi:hypothetical protein
MSLLAALLSLEHRQPKSRSQDLVPKGAI